jgi:putative transposase
MKKSRFTEQQIAYALRLAEQCTPAVEISRMPGVSEPTFYAWKKKYAGIGVTELRRIKQLEEDNGKPKQLVVLLFKGHNQAVAAQMTE